MNWWRDFILNSPINKGLNWLTLFHALMLMSSLWLPGLIQLIIVFALATAIAVYDLFKYIFLFRKFVGSEFSPSNALIGYLYISFFVSILGLSLLVPAVLNFLAIIQRPVTLFSFIITYFFSYTAWTFFLVAQNTKVNNA